MTVEVKTLLDLKARAAMIEAMRGAGASGEELRILTSGLEALAEPQLGPKRRAEWKAWFDSFFKRHEAHPAGASLKATVAPLLVGPAAPKPASPKPASPKPARVRRIAVQGPVYIAVDEYWPSSHDDSRARDGVIAGLVFTRGLGDATGWPIIPNHVARVRGLAEHRLSVVRAFNTEGVVPFVLPMRSAGEVAAKEYDALSDAALLILLGWVLAPGRSDQPVEVHVVLGEIGGHRRGPHCAERYAGLIEGLALVDPERFRGWEIRDVRFAAGEEFLVAYADAVGDLAHRDNPAMVRLARDVGLAGHPGYFELSVELLPRLLRLEQMERAGNVHDILDLAREIHGSRLLAGIFDDLRTRIARRPDLRDKLMFEINARFDRADLSAAALASLGEVVASLLPEPRDTAPVSLRALHAALRVQQANHRGAPEAVAGELTRWSELSSEARALHPTAALLLELHLAVHLNDRMAFADSERLMRAWTDEGRDLALAPSARGWLRSSLGQSLAYQGRHEDAATMFDAALTLLKASTEAPEQRKRDLDQTGCYRALNAVCAEAATARLALEVYLGNRLAEVAGRLAASSAPGDRYRHHLLVRWMYDSGAGGDAWESYANARSSWAQGEGHPWAWIGFYRALLEHREGTLTGEQAAGRCWELATGLRAQGSAMRLMGMVMGASSVCLADDAERRGELAAWLGDADADETLQGMKAAVEGLRSVVAAPAPTRVAEALGVAPFNWR